MVEFHSIASDFRVHATCMRWARSQNQEHIEYCVIVLYAMDCYVLHFSVSVELRKRSRNSGLLYS